MRGPRFGSRLKRSRFPTMVRAMMEEGAEEEEDGEDV